MKKFTFTFKRDATILDITIEAKSHKDAMSVVRYFINCHDKFDCVSGKSKTIPPERDEKLYREMTKKMLRADVVYLDGDTIRHRYKPEERKVKIGDMVDVEIESWDEESRVLRLITKQK